MLKETKHLKLEERMQTLGIHESEIFEKFILGSGKGGQKVNKTSSCVYLKHLPTGTEVKSQATRSREDNRFFARRLLCDKIEEQIYKTESTKQKLDAKIRRQKQRRTRKQKEKILGDKKAHSAKKALRQGPSD
ncbi:MAG: peptide chain release factor-like protein [Chlamydiota bacterium]